MMKTQTSLQALALMLPALLLAACSDSGSGDTQKFTDSAVIATRAPDYSAGAVSLVGVDAPYTASNNVVASDSSDIVVRSGGDHYFLIKRFGSDQVQRYESDKPGTPTYTYSTQDATDGSIDSNPADLIIVSETKAYLLRYGSGKMWIVNPAATTEAAFKTGEIDLSSYDSDGVPDMTAGLIKDGKLYVLLQRLHSFDATQDGYALVIDTTTNTVTKTIDLPVFNPSNLVALPGSSKLLAIAAGSYGSYPDYTPPYNGGIASIDTSSNTATLLLDDGDGTTHPYGQFGDIAIAAADRAYFVGSDGFNDETLYRFNPSVTPVTPVIVSAFTELALGSLAVDPSGNLWVARTDDSAPGVTILGYNGTAETVLAPLVDTDLTPLNIDFVTVPVAAP
jgi:hypothetical protein